MLVQLKALLAGNAMPAHSEADLRTAVAALLVETAWTAEGFEPRERAKIEALLQARFGISPAEAQELLKAGDRAGRETVHMLRFTKRILDGMPPEDRVDLIEMLWEVAFADGTLDPDEERLITKIAGLLFVSAGERNAAKRRARARAGLD
jgi:uncharacterized tellurite resistance protein B-like protein